MPHPPREVVPLPRGLVREVHERPAGYHQLQGWGGLSASGKALRCFYWGRWIWVPVKALRIHWESSTLFAPSWVFKEARNHPSTYDMRG